MRVRVRVRVWVRVRVRVRMRVRMRVWVRVRARVRVRVMTRVRVRVRQRLSATCLMMSSSVTALSVVPSSSSTSYVGPKRPCQPFTMVPGYIEPSLRIISIFWSGLNFMFVQGSSAIGGGGSAAAAVAAGWSREGRSMFSAVPPAQPSGTTML